MSAGPTVAVRVTTDVGDSATQASAVATNWDQIGLSGARAARSLTNGIGGILNAQQRVYDAQQRVNVANINYTLTVREYGAGSIQAARALDQLNVAQHGVALANEQLSLRYLQFALTVGPQVYTAITKMIAASAGQTLANYQETASWYAKAAAIGLTIGLLTAGIGIAGALISQSNLSTTINQQNTFNGVGNQSPGALINQTNTSIANNVASATRP